MIIHDANFTLKKDIYMLSVFIKPCVNNLVETVPTHIQKRIIDLGKTPGYYILKSKIFLTILKFVFCSCFKAREETRKCLVK